MLPVGAAAAFGGILYFVTLVTFGANSTTLNVGYRPTQVVNYSHEMHVNQLGIDCRYCHTTVDQADFAAIPHTQICLNCHHPADQIAGINKASPKLDAVRDSYITGMPVPWSKVHDLADYAYFSHKAHVNRGVGCAECHGRVDKMDDKGVYQVHNLSMSWCLDCHRHPEKYLRPTDQITNMSWQEPENDRLKIGLELKGTYNIRNQAYMTACSTCHR